MPPYGPRLFGRPAASHRIEARRMRQETQNIVDEIKQAIALLRRHL
jgi:hypothetical protein